MTDTSVNRSYELTQEELDALFICADCGVNTHHIGEYYMVTDEVWAAAGGRANVEGVLAHEMLCIGCIEHRLKRRLTFCDFMQVEANVFSPKSPRLDSRLFGKRWRSNALARYWLTKSALDRGRR